jgi:release factor glutamine methyltransferase
MEYVLNQTRSWVLAHPESLIDSDRDRQLAALVERRSRGEPMAYILGRREFYGLNFYVDSRVLIPRPETEVLIDVALRVIGDPSADVHIADVGTGSGAIALALATQLPVARLTAVDTSSDALEVARINAYRLELADRVTFLEADLLSWTREPVDMVVANLPYIPAKDLPGLPPEVREHEPASALNGGAGGLAPNLELIAQLPDRLKPGGHAFLECEPFQIADLTDAAHRSIPSAHATAVRDGYGHERFIHLTMPQ